MTDSTYAMTVEAFTPMLRSLSAILDKGADHASAEGNGPDALAHACLAPDMFPLVLQIKLACDFARDGADRLIGKPVTPTEPPKPTVAALKARIAETLEGLEKAPRAAFDGAGDRNLVVPLQGDLEMAVTGVQFIKDWTLPNFYFHVVTAYDILRHNGVQIGKQDYISQIGGMIRQRA